MKSYGERTPPKQHVRPHRTWIIWHFDNTLTRSSVLMSFSFYFGSLLTNWLPGSFPFTPVHQFSWPICSCDFNQQVCFLYVIPCWIFSVFHLLTVKFFVALTCFLVTLLHITGNLLGLVLQNVFCNCSPVILVFMAARKHEILTYNVIKNLK